MNDAVNLFIRREIRAISFEGSLSIRCVRKEDPRENCETGGYDET